VIHGQVSWPDLAALIASVLIAGVLTWRPWKRRR
jgi:hypothetical protein